MGSVALGYMAAMRTVQHTPVQTDPPRVQERGTESPHPAIEPVPESVTFAAVGDIMLSRAVGRKLRLKHDVNYPYEETRDLLSSRDVVFGNLESPITGGRDIADDELLFRSDPGVELGLRDAGFTILSLANNHMMNFGERGLRDTIASLDAAGIAHVGAGMTESEAYAPANVAVRGTRIAFLAYAEKDFIPASLRATATHSGVAIADVAKMQAGVAEASTGAEVIVVSMHAGVEYAQGPSRAQKEFARAAIDAGADLVIGHHPHVVQPMETYKGNTIVYSLGNFVFDQMWSRETREGVIMEASFTNGSVGAPTFTPILIEDYSQPRVLDGEEAARVAARLHAAVE